MMPAGFMNKYNSEIMRIAESELIINGDGSIFHLHMRPEQLADTVILVGDRGRVEMFKKYFTDIEGETSSREFVSFTGKYNGKRMTVLSTGIGIGNIDITMTELDALANIDFQTREPKAEHRRLTILRVGTCGAIQPEIPIGAYIFSKYSLGTDGIINWYADRQSVTEPDMEKAVVNHLRAHAGGLSKYEGMIYISKASERLTELFKDCTVQGITVAAPGFYGPQGRSVRIPLALPEMINDFESFRYGEEKITNFEMEGSALAAMARHLGHDGATVCCAIAHRYHKASNPDYKPMVEGLVKLVLDKLCE